jgi:hypothetical protein
MPEVLYAIGLASFLAVGAFVVFVRRQGDCDAVLESARAHGFTLTRDGDSAVASCLVPLTNRGRQDGMVIELLCEACHPGHVAGRPKIVPFAHVSGSGVAEDEDEGWYWKALLLHRGESVALRLGARITFRKRSPEEGLDALLGRLPGLMLRVHCKTIGRRSITWRLSELAFPWDEMVRRTSEAA